MQRLVVSVVADPDLGLEEHLGPIQIGAVHRLADLTLVAICGRGVNVPVPRGESGMDGVAGLVRRCLENTETERGDLDAVLESDGGDLVGHESTMRPAGLAETPRLSLAGLAPAAEARLRGRSGPRAGGCAGTAAPPSAGCARAPASG